jgi:nanoRNase/pAp phosphatase (c-di-AMP/oligoRNAs hydrolase)
MKKLVIYHGGACADGFCSAWLFHRAFPDAEFLAAQHGEPPPDVRGRDVTIVDFSYPHDVMKQMVADTGGEFVVLDHHKTAEKELAGLEGHYVFDQSKSGARLAWEFLFDNDLLPASFVRSFSRACSPWLVDYTEDRDLWRWQLDSSREISAALRSYPFTFDAWAELHSRLYFSLIPEGRAILRAERQVVDRHVRNAAEVELAGHKVLCVNATTLISEVAGELAKDRPFGVCWFERADGFRVYSLRSEPGGVDVSEIAKSFGGGGHKHAAGFQLSGAEKGRVAA